MPTPIESALIILVPTLNVLPTELIDLCSSLLAQSRAKATNLKPEEEIGRVFCCAHLGVVRYPPLPCTHTVKSMNITYVDKTYTSNSLVTNPTDYKNTSKSKKSKSLLQYLLASTENYTATSTRRSSRRPRPGLHGTEMRSKREVHRTRPRP